MDLLGKWRLNTRITTPEYYLYGIRPPRDTPLLPCTSYLAKMLFVAVNEPHTKEAIAYTHSVDPEIDHEDTQYKPGHRQEFLTLEKPREDALSTKES